MYSSYEYRLYLDPISLDFTESCQVVSTPIYFLSHSRAAEHFAASSILSSRSISVIRHRFDTLSSRLAVVIVLSYSYRHSIHLYQLSITSDLLWAVIFLFWGLFGLLCRPSHCYHSWIAFLGVLFECPTQRISIVSSWSPPRGGFKEHLG
jgi:hypothetical protein